MMINKRIQINMNQKVPLIMSFTNNNKAQQVFVETIIMLLNKINHTFNLSQVEAKFLLVSLFVFQLAIQYSHGSYLNLPISVVPTAQDLYQQFPQKQQQQQAANITPLESIYPTVNSHHSKSTNSFNNDGNNSHSSESIPNGSKVDPERYSNNKTRYPTDEMTSNKTTLSEQDDTLHEGTTAGLTSETNNQSVVTTSPFDSQIPDFTKNEDFNSMDENSITTKVHYFVPKSKRQALHTQQGATNIDWWSKISKSPNSNSKQHSVKTTQTSVYVDEKGPNQLEHRQEKVSRKRQPTNNNNAHHHQSPALKGVGRGVGTKKANEGSEIGSRSVYKEQPMNQNAIFTLKNQLAAIRGKHKQLVTTSVSQLQQLDNKLIESYKLCFKRKMPLYAGMLYRTRDFVVRMAKDVKHESKVLEAMTKQVQSVLRQRMSNKTLIREYNQLVAKSIESKPLQQQQQHIITSFESVQIQNDQQGIKVISTNKIGSNSIKVKKESSFEPTDLPHYIQENTLPQTNEASQIGKKIRTGTKGPLLASKSPSTDQSGLKHSVSEHDIKNLTATKKPKLKYTVSVNEVNLKKELNKIQALIDRVNGSTNEISAVVDDIVRLFKLTSEKKSFSISSKTTKIDKTHTPHPDDPNGSQQNDITATTITTTTTISGHQQMVQKRSKKMLKSPIRVFLEKYGKLTMGNLEMPNNNSTVTTSDSENLTNIMMRQPDFKPLFESTNLNYSESLDVDTGFDYITTENE